MKLTNKLNLPQPDTERFWSKVKKAGSNDCWHWIGTMRGNRGYGVFSYLHRNYSPHRISYILCVAEIKSGMVIRHLCNNPGCVNPKHLAQGTHKENQADRLAAGTMLYGEKNPISKANPGSAASRKKISEFRRSGRHPGDKLDNKKVLSIRSEYASGLFTQAELAKKYSVAGSVISRVASGKLWGHVK